MTESRAKKYCNRMADRRRELILTGGFNVYPSQVEAAIRDMEAKQ